MLKGQVSIEFLMIMGFLLLTLSVFTIGILKQHINFVEDKEYVLVRDIAYKVRDEIVLANNVQASYVRNFSLPAQVDGLNYSIHLTSDVIIVRSQSQEFSLNVPHITGCIDVGNISITKLQNQTLVFHCT